MGESGLGPRLSRKPDLCGPAPPFFVVNRSVPGSGDVDFLVAGQNGPVTDTGNTSQLNEANITMNVELSLPSAKRVLTVLLIVIAILLTFSTMGQISKYFLGHPELKGFVSSFYVDYESNVPTWYSSIALGVAAGLLALIAMAKFAQRDRFRFHWTVLGLLFLGLSLDEVSMFHEYPIDPMRRAFDFGGAFYYAWVIPGFAFVAIVGLSFTRFLWNLPSQTARLFILAGAIFVGGAIGVEMLSGVQADRFGEENFTYAMIITLEEACEMTGVAVFVSALVGYINNTLGGLRVRIGAMQKA